jgi:hypothetical protein
MKIKTALFGLALLAGISGPAFSAATPEEAQRLTEVLQTYLGKEPGVVSVTLEGDSYRARFDAAPLFAKMKEPGVSLSLTPIEWVITSQGGGKWQVDQNQPLTFQLKADGDVEMKVEAGLVKGTSVFDEALGSFSSTSSQISRFTLDQTFSEQGQTQRSNMSVDSITYTSSMTGSGDSADATFDASYKGLRQTASVPSSGAAPATDVVTASPDGTQTAVIKGLKPKAMSALLAWVVAHPSAETAAAGQAELKDKLRAALPFFNSMSSTSTMNSLGIGAEGGQFGLKQLTFTADTSGMLAEGRIRQRYALTGLQVPAEVVPPWAATLVPENSVVDFDVSGFDLAAAAALIIDKMDLSKDPSLPDGFEDELVKALMPTGAVQVGLGPSEILATAFQLNAEGSMTAGPAVMPAGKAIVKLAGIDQLMAALQSAPPEMDMQSVAPMLLLIRGLAKQEADGTLSWAIESTPTGSVTVNGTDLTKMMSGQ